MRDKQVMLEYAASSSKYLPVGIYLLKVNNKTLEQVVKYVQS